MTQDALDRLECAANLADCVGQKLIRDEIRAAIASLTRKDGSEGPEPPVKDDLQVRLTTMYSHRGDGIPTQYVNPDGPEAAARIEALETAVAECACGQARTTLAALTSTREGLTGGEA